MTTKTHARTVDEAIASARALLAEKQAELDVLTEQAKLNLVRGTREITKTIAHPQATLDEQLVAALTERAQDTATLSATIGVPVGRVLPIVKSLRDKLKIHNIGSEVEPRWQHVLPIDCSTPDLRALVLRLISDRPFTHRELTIVTGANENRISGVLAKLKVDPKLRVANLGNGAKGKWFVLPSVQFTPRRTNR